MIEINATTKYALAVSGGVDSMVMLHMFATALSRPNFYVVTINHGIRYEASADCQFVASYCKAIGVECRVVKIDVPTFCAERKVSVETGARILRYEVLDGLDADVVCLAHNADDNAETVLMHVLRGSGARGASGIKQRNGKYYRPLLDMTRTDIEQYAKEHGVPHVNDSTNDETKYTRNYIRHNVMPQLKALNGSTVSNLLRFADNIRSDDEHLQSLIDMSAVTFEDDCAKIPNELLTQPTPISYRLLLKVFNRLGVYYDIEKTHLESVVALADSVGGKSVSLPFNLVATNDYDCVTIWRNAKQDKQEFEIDFAVGKTETPLGVVEVSKEAIDGALRLDVNKLPANCVFRTRRQGDFFTKFGGGTKSLKKYLIDKKIPERKRDSLLLLACGNEVLVVCGVEIADSVRVDDGAQSFYIKLHE